MDIKSIVFRAHGNRIKKKRTNTILVSNLSTIIIYCCCCCLFNHHHHPRKEWKKKIQGSSIHPPAILNNTGDGRWFSTDDWELSICLKNSPRIFLGMFWTIEIDGKWNHQWESSNKERNTVMTDRSVVEDSIKLVFDILYSNHKSVSLKVIKERQTNEKRWIVPLCLLSAPPSPPLCHHRWTAMTLPVAPTPTTMSFRW